MRVNEASTDITVLFMVEPKLDDDAKGIPARTPGQLGHAVRRYRVRKGMSQGALGQAVRFRQQTISDLENGKGRIKTLSDVLSALELELVVRPRRRGTDIDIEDLV